MTSLGTCFVGSNLWRETLAISSCLYTGEQEKQDHESIGNYLSTLLLLLSCERPDSWDFVAVLYTWEGKMPSVQKLVLVLSCEVALAKVLFFVGKTCIWLFAQIVHWRYGHHTLNLTDCFWCSYAPLVHLNFVISIITRLKHSSFVSTHCS